MNEILDSLTDMPQYQFLKGALKGGSRGVYNLVDEVFFPNSGEDQKRRQQLQGIASGDLLPSEKKGWWDGRAVTEQLASEMNPEQFEPELWEQLKDYFYPGAEKGRAQEKQRSEDLPFVSDLAYGAGDFAGGIGSEALALAYALKNGVKTMPTIGLEGLTSYLTGSNDTGNRLQDATLTMAGGAAGSGLGHVATMLGNGARTFVNFANPSTAPSSFVADQLAINSSNKDNLLQMLKDNSDFLKDKFPDVPFNTSEVSKAGNFYNNPKNVDSLLATYGNVLGKSNPLLGDMNNKTLNSQEMSIVNNLFDLAGKKPATNPIDGYRPPKPDETFSDYHKSYRNDAVQPYYSVFDDGIVNYSDEIKKAFDDLVKTRPGFKKATRSADFNFRTKNGNNKTEKKLQSPYVQEVFQAIRDEKSMAERAGERGKASAYKSLSNDFNDLLEELSPEFLEGNRIYREASEPINRNLVAEQLLDDVAPAGYKVKDGNEVLDKLDTDRINMTKIKNFYKDPSRTVQKALGKNVNTKELLDGNFSDSINNLKDLVSLIQDSAKTGKVGGANTAQNISVLDKAQKAVNASLSPLSPDRLIRFGNAFVRSKVGERKLEFDKLLAEALADPKKAIEILQQTPPTIMQNKISKPLMGGGFASGELTEGDY